MRRRRATRVLVASACGIVLAGTAAYAGAWLTTDRSGASRAVAWLEADPDDIDRFPSRAVPAGDDVVPLPAGEPLDLATAWGVEDPEGLLRASRTTAFLVVQDGAVRYERYLGGTGPDDLRTSFSVAKSVVSTLVGLAVEDGHIGSIDDPVTAYVPELLDRDARFADVTLRDLMTMSSGLCYVERGLPWSDDARTYYDTDLRRAALSARVCEPAATEFLYNNYNPLLEGLVLERATGRTVSAYLAERVWGPMGAEADASWSLDSERSGFEKMESGLNAVPRDFARFGMLVARGGRAGDRQVVPREWLDLATSAARAGGATPFYALHWWTGIGPDRPLPEGHVMARGNHGQYVYVVPGRDLVIVRLGDAYGVDDWPQRLARLASAL